MKRLALLMGLGLVMALAVPAAAGINTEITGKVQTDLYWNEGDGVWAWGDVETKITMSAGTEGPIKAVVSLGASEANDEGKFGRPGDNAEGGDNGGSPLVRTAPVELKVDKAYIEAEGPWFEGLPSGTTRFGRFDTNYSDWVANFGDRDGIEFGNVNLGGLTLSAMYAWLNAGPFSDDYLEKQYDKTVRGEIKSAVDGLEWRLNALRASTSLDVVDLTGVYVRTYSGGDRVLNDYAVTASVTPVNGLKISGTYAATDYKGLPAKMGVEQKGTGWKVDAELSTIPNIKLGASVWASEDDFNPIYAKLDDKKPVAFRGWDKPNERKGVEVSASTTQAGFDLGLKVANTTNAAGANEATSYEFTAKRDFDGITASYKYEDGTDKDALHTFTAETTIDTPILKALKVKGTLRLPEKKDVEYAADVTWQAPNGFNVGVHYANYDRKEDWGGKNVNGDNKPDGFTIKAGYTINF